ncbi:hypothetical protein SAMD00079811_44760 [Scytonema sp. HK-05]|nr:hypothetical protein SAMD00079811_44760 [Scytonema sp. HK-05]
MADDGDKFILESFYFAAIANVLHEAVMTNIILLYVVGFDHNHLRIKLRTVLTYTPGFNLRPTVIEHFLICCHHFFPVFWMDSQLPLQTHHLFWLVACHAGISLVNRYVMSLLVQPGDTFYRTFQSGSQITEFCFCLLAFAQRGLPFADIKNRTPTHDILTCRILNGSCTQKYW